MKTLPITLKKKHKAIFLWLVGSFFLLGGLVDIILYMSQRLSGQSGGVWVQVFVLIGLVVVYFLLASVLLIKYLLDVVKEQK